jgi:hypothetical protein
MSICLQFPLRRTDIAHSAQTKTKWLDSTFGGFMLPDVKIQELAAQVYDLYRPVPSWQFLWLFPMSWRSSMGGFSEPSLLGMDCPTMLAVGQRAEANSDCSSCSSLIVAALCAMSWVMELQKRIVSIASYKVKHLWVCSLDPSIVARDSCKIRHKSVLLLYQRLVIFMCISKIKPWR